MRCGNIPAPWFWVAVAIALLVSFAIDLVNTERGGAIDLRNRVTGIRLMAHGANPYVYKWHSGLPDVYCDVYNNPRLPVSKTTASPTLLLLLDTYQAEPYRLSEFLWLGAQWLMLLGAAGAALWSCPVLEMRRGLALFVTAFTYTAAWRLHAERGQAYIVLVLVFVAWLGMWLHPRARGGLGVDFAAGLLAGVLILLRPTFALLLPFIALQRRGQLLGALLGMALAVAAPMAVRVSCWSEYAAAMQANSELYRNNIDPRPGPQTYPAQIEGTSTDLIAAFAVIPYADFSAFALLRALGLDHSWLEDAAVPAWPPLLIFVGSFAAWTWWTRRSPVGKILSGLAAWVFLADLVLPAYRDTYNDVLILPVIAAALMSSDKVPWPAWICAAALPLGWLVYAIAPEQVALINLPTALLTLGAAGFVISTADSKRWDSSRQKEPAA